MKATDEEESSIFPLLQLHTLSPARVTPHDMSASPRVPHLPRIDCNSSVISRRSSGSTRSSSCRFGRGKFSGSCPARSTTGRSTAGSQNSESSTSSRNGRLYTPVEFEITPLELPYMGTDYRTVGRVRRVPTESSALKQNEVRYKVLERKTNSLARRKDQIQKDFTRTLNMWHMEEERNKNHKDPALERRTLRILKFIDKMTESNEDFHFKDGFFLDIMDPEYLPSPTPSPTNMTRLDSKRPIVKLPTPDIIRSNGGFKRRNSKTDALERKFRDCKRAGEVQGYGYVYVKIYTDPYYRYLPPLSDASKNYTVRLAKLPHKRLRNEEQWKKFLESLKPKTPPPPPPKPAAPTMLQMRKTRTDELKKKLPIITLLPKWLREVREKNDIRTERYKTDDDLKPVTPAEAMGSPGARVSRASSRPNSRRKVQRKKKSPVNITETHTKEDMNGVLNAMTPKLNVEIQQNDTVVERPLDTPIKHRIQVPR